MPRELVTLQVGQCGNQIGRRFWELALQEHAQQSRDAVFDDAMSSFFRNVDARGGAALPVGSPLQSLRARAILVDMEEGPVWESLRGPLGELFEQRQTVTEQSGSGNNWAHGFHVYGAQCHEAVTEAVRHAAELCDSLQCFFLMHSLGGGTGSGLGSYICSLLADEFPGVYRFSTAVLPSDNDDVVTSAYNSVLALRELTEHADCVLPLDNQALVDIVSRHRGSGGGGESGGGEQDGGGFDEMNALAAHLLANLTASSRFEGDLNVDLNEITTNLVPFPRMQFLIPALAPLSTGARAPRRLDEMFQAAFSRESQLLCAAPRQHTYLACGLLVRGAVEVSDVQRNVERAQRGLRMAGWNQEGFKVGLCGAPPVGGHPYALLALANNAAIATKFRAVKDAFDVQYARKARVFHYTREDGMEEAAFDAAAHSLEDLIQRYEDVDRNRPVESRRRRIPAF